MWSAGHHTTVAAPPTMPSVMCLVQPAPAVTLMTLPAHPPVAGLELTSRQARLQATRQ